MAEVGGEGFRVDAGRNQDRCERVPALVQANRGELRFLPPPVRPVDQRIAVERAPAVAKEELCGAAPSQLARREVGAESGHSTQWGVLVAVDGQASTATGGRLRKLGAAGSERVVVLVLSSPAVLQRRPWARNDPPRLGPGSQRRHTTPAATYT